MPVNFFDRWLWISLFFISCFLGYFIVQVLYLWSISYLFSLNYFFNWYLENLLDCGFLIFPIMKRFRSARCPNHREKKLIFYSETPLIPLCPSTRSTYHMDVRCLFAFFVWNLNFVRKPNLFFFKHTSKFRSNRYIFITLLFSISVSLSSYIAYESFIW